MIQLPGYQDGEEVETQINIFETRFVLSLTHVQRPAAVRAGRKTNRPALKCNVLILWIRWLIVNLHLYYWTFYLTRDRIYIISLNYKSIVWLLLYYASQNLLIFKQYETSHTNVSGYIIQEVFTRRMRNTGVLHAHKQM